MILWMGSRRPVPGARLSEPASSPLGAVLQTGVNLAVNRSDGGVVDVITAVVPGADSRSLFGSMVARADDNLILQLDQALFLTIERQSAGKTHHVDELLAAGWIEPHPDGGWALSEALVQGGRMQ